MSRKVVSAYSGGLDSTLVTILLREHYKFDEVIPVLVDVGQGEEEIETAFERAEKLGLDVVFIDGKREFVEEFVHRCIKANGSYEGYPIGTSMSRAFIASKCVEVALKEGAEAVAHGCTGKGNDQFRIEFTVKYLAPHLEVIAPVRELNLVRTEEEKMLAKYGITPKPRKGKLGGDINLWSHSIGSGQVEDLYSQYPEDYIWVTPPEQAPDKPQEVSIEFREGIPVRVDDVKDPVEVILYLNRVGGIHGVGLIDILEDGMIGLKSRELYEAPAATILLKTHRDLEQLTITKDQLRFKSIVDMLWADMVYHAMWFHPLRKDLDAFIDSTQKHVNGTIYVKLYKGNFYVVGRESPSSLFAPELRSLKRTGFDQRDSIGYARIGSLLYQLLGKLDR
ncbi:MAG: argininosuccinate synthase [Nitrososphaerota archaeon]|nr:argininosuccinate synthase [Candidatus Bathyarchaeota archaeon]MCX8162895.1 argininosuccinate synthase [Candidatus Bathyarchaeota archaeon]MDW8061538.1 argininosuccinate synthase [Nitrososphaerota archaeon]